MLDQLIKDKKISLKEHRIYSIFGMEDRGIELLKMYKKELFEAVPQDINALGTLAFLEGRRNVFKEIDFTIERINKLLEKGEVNVK